jgi:hypothetical protein
MDDVSADTTYLASDSLPTSGSQAAGDPCCTVYGNQMHCCYRDWQGNIMDAWCDGNGMWNIMWLSGSTLGPKAAGDPCFTVYNNQAHCCYRDVSGHIQNAWYDGNQWSVQPVTGHAMTPAPVAAGDPCLTSYTYRKPGLLYLPTSQMHCCYRDGAGIIWDAVYAGGRSGNTWNLQQLTGAGGLTSAPKAAGDSCLTVYGNQMHCCYRDVHGHIQDVWYDGNHDTWNLQQLTGSGGRTSAPKAAGDPCLTVCGNETHCCYRDVSGDIQDAWYDENQRSWNLLHLTGVGGLTLGPKAAGDPCLTVYRNQTHCCYRDDAGALWDAWYDEHQGRWNLQQLTGAGGLTLGPRAAGDPCLTVCGNQMHCCYRDSAGVIRDAWWNGVWNVQQLTVGSAPDSWWLCLLTPNEILAPERPQGRAAPSQPSEGARKLGAARRFLKSEGDV